MLDFPHCGRILGDVSSLCLVQAPDGVHWSSGHLDLCHLVILDCRRWNY